MRQVSIIIVDDHPLFSRGLAALITSHNKYVFSGDAKNCEEAPALIKSKKPDLAIVDLRLGNEDGLEVIKKMKALQPGLFILVLSMQQERYFAERALNAGSGGYIMKTESGATVMEAIRTVLSGKIYLSEAEQERLRESSLYAAEGNPFHLVEKLSNRQLQVFILLGKGLGTLEIASHLNISAKTVNCHRENMKLRLNCASTQELRQFAVEWVRQ